MKLLFLPLVDERFWCHHGRFLQIPPKRWAFDVWLLIGHPWISWLDEPNVRSNRLKVGTIFSHEKLLSCEFLHFWHFCMFCFVSMRKCKRAHKLKLARPEGKSDETYVNVNKNKLSFWVIHSKANKDILNSRQSSELQFCQNWKSLNSIARLNHHSQHSKSKNETPCVVSLKPRRRISHFLINI